jgi:hypothetical protein
MSLRFKIVRIHAFQEPRIPGLYQCRGCKWIYFHPERDYWSNVLFDQDGKLFRTLDKLQYSTWEEWSNEQADCVRNLARIVRYPTP